MAKFNEKQVREINSVIAGINKSLESLDSSKCQIGARNKTTLLSLVKANKMPPVKTTFFPCQREYSDSIVSHFVTEKKLAKSKFSMGAQESVFILTEK